MSFPLKIVHFHEMNPAGRIVWRGREDALNLTPLFRKVVTLRKKSISKNIATMQTVPPPWSSTGATPLHWSTGTTGAPVINPPLEGMRANKRDQEEIACRLGSSLVVNSIQYSCGSIQHGINWRHRYSMLHTALLFQYPFITPVHHSH